MSITSGRGRLVLALSFVVAAVFVGAPAASATSTPAPTSVSPSSVPQGGSVATTITGTGFQPGASVYCGSGFCPTQTSYVDATRIDVTFGADVGAALGPRDVTVKNTDGGTGTCTGCLTVTAGPHVSSVSGSATRGQPATLTITGDNFQAGASIVQPDGCCGYAVTINWSVRDSSTQMRVNVTGVESSTSTQAAVFVRNPDSGRAAAVFTIVIPPVVITGVSDGARDIRRGGGNTFRVWGTGFAETPTVGVFDPNSGRNLGQTTVRRTGPNELTVSAGAPVDEPLGPLTIHVGNYDGTAGACDNCAVVTPQSYWMAARDGGVFAFGHAPFLGSMGGKPLNKPIVGMAGTPSGRGYWLVASDGGIFAYGDAPFYGSMGGKPLNQPIVGMAATPSGRGYWLVASDGGMFAYGDAPFLGSMGGKPLNQPIDAMVPSADGRGYGMVAKDGGMFNYGDFRFWGSAAGKTAAPVVGVVMDRFGPGHGYVIVASDGSVFPFNDYAWPEATPIAGLSAPITAASEVETPQGYRLVGADGAEYGLGLDDTRGLRGTPPARPIVGVAMQGQAP